MAKRRILIFGTTGLLYAVLLFVMWVVGTQQAAEKTEVQLDYAILDFRDTIAGAIDTMLGNVANTIVRDLGEPKPITTQEAQRIAAYHGIDEMNVISREGTVIATSDPTVLGCTMLDRDVAREFMVLTNGTTKTFSQDFRHGAHNTKVRRKYLGCAFPNGNGFIQVGLDDSRLARMLPTILGYIFDKWLLGQTGFFLCADAATDRLISNPVHHQDEAGTLAETGFDEAVAAAYAFESDKTVGKTFVQRLYGEKCYCRNYLFAGHRFVPSLPEREYYSTRTVYVGVFGILLFVVLSAIALFMNRIFRDSDKLREYYVAEARHRANEMLIAKTIQNSALPNLPPDSHYFDIYAIMHAAKEVGGDFYDYFMLDATHVAFLVADVSGKGVSSALYMMTAKTLIRDRLSADWDPATALTAANEELCRNNPANMFLTAWVGVLDLETGVVTFANAGHNPPLLCTKTGVKFLRTKSGPVLAYMDGIAYKSNNVVLGVGDALLAYTDGVTEALNEENALFGEDRLMTTVQSAATNSPETLCRTLRSAVAAFSAKTAQADDITILSIRRTAAPRTFVRTFPPNSSGVAKALEFLDEVLSCPPAVESAAHIILDEICSNIVKHSGASGFEVDVELLDNPDGVKLTFVDDGKAYDPLSHVDPDTTLSAEERPIGGLGILMVKKMSDSVSYSRVHNRNSLTVVKTQKPSA
jgi:serine phosphatase RsbU (regulator of sigma subunit)/anti-sigma regulatory factor (Ser/Thr protein kinase)